MVPSGHTKGGSRVVVTPSFIIIHQGWHTQEKLVSGLTTPKIVASHQNDKLDCRLRMDRGALYMDPSGCTNPSLGK